ncbi:MAG: AAA family ATPase [Bdellovibrionales bacterium]|nr:AAA family ATPase [Bdellovibrionales bacterium]
MMPHPRSRHAIPLLLKKLRFSPVVAIQGARQTGKSFLVRELLSEKLPYLEYVSLDRRVDREFAAKNPETFIERFPNASPLVIDEAQKAPALFDALKYSVDSNRAPGRFLILGSTEFSKLSLIRESLTGRVSRLRLYSMNLAEALGATINPARSISLLNNTPRFTRSQLLQHLERGGMPGVFAVRDRNERESILRDWLDLTTDRDAMLFSKIKADPDLCRQILEKVATLEEPDAGSIARALRRDLRRIKTHLEILTSLFALHVLHPHPAGTGKPWYFLCDVAFSRLLGASFERQLHTWLLHEQLSQRSYRDLRESQLYYYRTPKGRIVHLLIQSDSQLSALQVFSEERILERDMALLKALSQKLSSSKVELLGLAPARISFPAGQGLRKRIEIYPWESMA